MFKPINIILCISVVASSVWSPSTAHAASVPQNLGICSLYASPFLTLSVGGWLAVAALAPLAPAFAVVTGVSIGGCMVARSWGNGEAGPVDNATARDEERAIRTLVNSAAQSIDAKKDAALATISQAAQSAADLGSETLALRSEEHAKKLLDQLDKQATSAVREIYEEVERVRNADLAPFTQPNTTFQREGK